jgi:hypothetical protein
MENDTDELVNNVITALYADLHSWLMFKDIEQTKKLKKYLDLHHKILSTGLVKIHPIGSEGIYAYKLNPKGFGIVKKFGSYSAYLNFINYEQNKIQNKPLVHIDNSTHTIGNNNLVTTHSELEKVQQSTGSSSFQKMDFNPPAKGPIINKIIIGVIIGLLVIVIGHFAFHIG